MEPNNRRQRAGKSLKDSKLGPQDDKALPGFRISSSGFLSVNAGLYGSAQGAARKWDQRFESTLLQQRVRNELGVPGSTPMHPRRRSRGGPLRRPALAPAVALERDFRLTLIAVARYLAAHFPTQRALLQTADIASRLTRGGELHREMQ